MTLVDPQAAAAIHLAVRYSCLDHSRPHRRHPIELSVRPSLYLGLGLALKPPLSQETSWNSHVHGDGINTRGGIGQSRRQYLLLGVIEMRVIADQFNFTNLGYELPRPAAASNRINM